MLASWSTANPKKIVAAGTNIPASELQSCRAIGFIGCLVYRGRDMEEMVILN
jgi:hypothetical protein